MEPPIDGYFREYEICFIATFACILVVDASGRVKPMFEHVHHVPFFYSA